MCRARLTAEADWLIWCVTQPTYQSSIERMPFFTDGAGGPLGLDGHHGVDEGGGVDHPQGLAQVAAATGHRGVGQEQLVELALELGRQVARGPAQAHLLGDLGHHLLDVGPRIGRQRRLGVAHGASPLSRARPARPSRRRSRSR